MKNTAISVALLLLLLLPAGVSAQAPLVGLGDSIGEGVQSADASQSTQPFSYINLIAAHMGIQPFPLPLIQTSLFGTVGSMEGRSRINPSVAGMNLSVNGATVGSLLRDRANAATTAQIDSETDLILYPRQGSQMEVAESMHPQVVACWIGNNDALSAVLAYDHLDGSQMTPIPQFEADFTEIVNRIQAMGAKAVFGTIPNVTRIAYLVDNADMVRLLGTSHGLPNGSWIGLPTLLGLKLGSVPSTIVNDPNFVLTTAEANIISARIDAFNAIIRNVATAHGMAVAETGALFEFLGSNPVTIAGVPINTRFLGGLFSLDGVHPSNFGQALAASMFMEALNARYSLGLPPFNGNLMGYLFVTDPFIDKDQDGRVAGRFGAGLLELIAAVVGISGDTNDPLPSAMTSLAQ